MELSENPEAYEFYFRHFLKFLIPSTAFKNCLKQHPTSLSFNVDRLTTSIKGAKDMVEFVTVAEERLGLFILENDEEVGKRRRHKRIIRWRMISQSTRRERRIS